MNILECGSEFGKNERKKKVIHLLLARTTTRIADIAKINSNPGVFVDAAGAVVVSAIFVGE